MRKQWIFRIILYLSILFLIFYLVRFDYFKLANLKINYVYLSFSCLLLWAGFLFSALSWGYSLKVHGKKTEKKHALISHGLSVFAKYIPGKIWVILGRASYIANKKNYQVSELSFISLKEQLIYILLGLIISIFPTLIYYNQDYWVWFVLLTICILTATLFISPVHDLFEKILSLLSGKNILLPKLSLKLSLKLGLRILIYWGFWIVGFYLFILSITPEIKLHHAFVFPLAVCYGVLAVILPGGIGVREGIITAYLTATGIETQLAITISIMSRLWFISGEIFIFLLGLIFKRRKK